MASTTASSLPLVCPAPNSALQDPLPAAERRPRSSRRPGMPTHMPTELSQDPHRASRLHVLQMPAQSESVLPTHPSGWDLPE